MLIAFLFILVLIPIAIYLYVQSGPQLPPETDTLIKEVLSEKLPKLISGRTGKAMNGHVSLYYEVMEGEDHSKGNILLINGHSSTLLYWQPYFYQPLLDAGYRLIRFDNRGIGMSDWIQNWSKETAFTLEDMAKDAMAVLDACGIEKAHVLGMSMGGMIAQRIAISHSERVLSLCSIMSSGFINDPELTTVPAKFKADLTRLTLRYMLKPTEINRMKMQLGVMKVLEGDGDYALDPKAVLQATLYNIRRRDGMNKKLRDQHTWAITYSGSRYEELASIKVPSLVIHGTADPLVEFEHGKKYAAMIPQAETLFIVGMGHDIPQLHIQEIHKAIFRNLDAIKNNRNKVA
ncbi:MAG: alpha/beta hydrolase [Bacteroidia bacterium]|nr:alpha/beta hydrolase [Bacteroidia bacterium]